MNEVNIRRNIYINRIKPHLGKPIIKVLTGQRRVGKSFILLQLIEEIKLSFPDANIIYINLEMLEFGFLKTHESLCQFVDSRWIAGKQNFLLVDEIQEVKSFETCLCSLLASSKCDIICTGSNAQMLSGELATRLSGRYIQFPVYSLGYVEFLEFHRLENTNESLNAYLKFGGMPYLVHTGLVQEVAFEYLKNVNSTILLKDVVARENIRNIGFLENLVAFLADNTGSLLSALNISKYLKSQQQNIPPQTVLNYLRALTNSFYVYKVLRANIGGLKIFEVGEKYYFEDLGLRNSIRKFDFRRDVNKLMKNVVYMHLLRLGYLVFIGKIGEKEIDFMAEKDGERVYFQVSYLLFDEKTTEREFGNLLLIKDNYPKYVISMDETTVGTSYKGIRQFHLRDFLSTFSF